MEKQRENRWESREVGCGGGDQLKTGSRSLKTRLYRGGWELRGWGGVGCLDRPVRCCVGWNRGGMWIRWCLGILVWKRARDSLRVINWRASQSNQWLFPVYLCPLHLTSLRQKHQEAIRSAACFLWCPCLTHWIVKTELLCLLCVPQVNQPSNETDNLLNKHCHCRLWLCGYAAPESRKGF